MPGRTIAAWASLLVLALAPAMVLRVDAPGRPRPRAPAAGTPAGLAVSMRVPPFGTVVVGLFTPLALSLYLLTSTTWTVAERALLPRLLRG